MKRKINKKEVSPGCSVSEGGGSMGGPEGQIGSEISAPDVCHGDVQSGSTSGGTRDGPVSPVPTWSNSTSDSSVPVVDMETDSCELPGARTAVATPAPSGVTSSKGSKMRGRSSEDIVPSVAVSCKGGALASMAVSKIHKHQKMLGQD